MIRNTTIWYFYVAILVNKSLGKDAMNQIARRYLLPGGIYDYKTLEKDKENANDRLEQRTNNA